MSKPFWARVDCKKWVGRFEVDSAGIIKFAPPIMYRWKGRKWIELIQHLIVSNALNDYQIYRQDIDKLVLFDNFQ